MYRLFIRRSRALGFNKKPGIWRIHTFKDSYAISIVTNILSKLGMFLEVTLVICIPILTWEIKMTFGSTNLIQPSGWKFESHRVVLNQCHVQLTVRLYIKSGCTYSLAMTVIFLAQVYIYSRVFIDRKYLWFEWNVSKKIEVNFPKKVWAVWAQISTCG